jgi:DNA-directed RNA polymerase subunit RPC12/RpoP
MSIDAGIMHFFDEPDNKGRERILEVAKPIVMYKCVPGCGANLPTENMRGTTVQCTKCGKKWSIQPIAYAGQVH